MKKLLLIATTALLAQSAFAYDIQRAEYDRKESSDVVYVSFTNRQYLKRDGIYYSIFNSQRADKCSIERHAIHKQFESSGYSVKESNCSADGAYIEIVFKDINLDKEKKSDM